MPAERVSMRKIRDVRRLTHALGMSRRLVGEATGIGKTAVGEYVRRAAVAGLSWPIPDEIDDAELERQLFPPADTASCAARTEPDWSHIHAELKGRGVTLALLWQEYRAEHAQGYAYSWFCERHSDWRKRISATMRQTHLAGEKLFVDWAGDSHRPLRELHRFLSGEFRDAGKSNRSREGRPRFLDQTFDRSSADVRA